MAFSRRCSRYVDHRRARVRELRAHPAMSPRYLRPPWKNDEPEDRLVARPLIHRNGTCDPGPSVLGSYGDCPGGSNGGIITDRRQIASVQTPRGILVRHELAYDPQRTGVARYAERNT